MNVLHERPPSPSHQLCLEDVEDVPVTPDDMEIEELDCAVGDSQGIGAPTGPRFFGGGNML